MESELGVRLLERMSRWDAFTLANELWVDARPLDTVAMGARQSVAPLSSMPPGELCLFICQKARRPAQSVGLSGDVRGLAALPATNRSCGAYAG